MLIGTALESRELALFKWSGDSVTPLARAMAPSAGRFFSVILSPESRHLFGGSQSGDIFCLSTDESTDPHPLISICNVRSPVRALALARRSERSAAGETRSMSTSPLFFCGTDTGAVIELSGRPSCFPTGPLFSLESAADRIVSLLPGTHPRALLNDGSIFADNCIHNLPHGTARTGRFCISGELLYAVVGGNQVVCYHSEATEIIYRGRVVGVAAPTRDSVLIQELGEAGETRLLWDGVRSPPLAKGLILSDALAVGEYIFVGFINGKVVQYSRNFVEIRSWHLRDLALSSRDSRVVTHSESNYVFFTNTGTALRVSAAGLSPIRPATARCVTGSCAPGYTASIKDKNLLISHDFGAYEICAASPLMNTSQILADERGIWIASNSQILRLSIALPRVLLTPGPGDVTGISITPWGVIAADLEAGLFLLKDGLCRPLFNDSGVYSIQAFYYYDDVVVIGASYGTVLVFTVADGELNLSLVYRIQTPGVDSHTSSVLIHGQ